METDLQIYGGIIEILLKYLKSEKCGMLITEL